MDDFIYGEPVGVAATATPAPASLPVLGAALGLLAALRRRR
jgi:MYXO-CTERM domain-containing protein